MEVVGPGGSKGSVELRVERILLCHRACVGRGICNNGCRVDGAVEGEGEEAGAEGLPRGQGVSRLCGLIYHP